MSDNFIAKWGKLAINDFLGLVNDFTQYVVAFAVVSLLFYFLNKKKKDDSFSGMLDKKDSVKMKKVLVQLEKEEFQKEYITFFSELLGIDKYVYVDAGFLIHEIVDDTDSMNFDIDEKKLREFIQRNNEDLTLHFKKNIVNLYLCVNNGEATYVSPIHLFFFAHYFPTKIDANLEGSFLLKTNEFTVDDIVKKAEDKNDKFVFQKFFFQVIGLINDEEITISNFVKIKEVFGKNISTMVEGMPFQKMITPKIVLRKNNTVKKPIKKVLLAKKILKAEVEEDQVEKNAKLSVNNRVENQKNKTAKKDAEKINKNKNSTQDKKEIFKDIQEQKDAVEAFEKNKKEDEKIEAQIISEKEQTQDENIANLIQENLNKNRADITTENSDDTNLEAKNEAADKESTDDKNKEKIFEVAKGKKALDKKTSFKFAIHFNKVLKNIAEDPKSIKFIFSDNDGICISLHFLYLKIIENYNLSDTLGFDNKFLLDIIMQPSNKVLLRGNSKKNPEIGKCVFKINNRNIQCTCVCSNNSIYLRNGFSKIIDDLKYCNGEKKNEAELLNDEEMLELIKGEIYG